MSLNMTDTNHASLERRMVEYGELLKQKQQLKDEMEAALDRVIAEAETLEIQGKHSTDFSDTHVVEYVKKRKEIKMVDAERLMNELKVDKKSYLTDKPFLIEKAEQRELTSDLYNDCCYSEFEPDYKVKLRKKTKKEIQQEGTFKA